MRRLVDVPAEYLVAALLAGALAVGLYLLSGSGSSMTRTTATSAAAPQTHTPPAQSPSVPVRTNNQQALELIARSRQAYRHVRGVSLAFHLPTGSLHFTMVLRNGRIVGESYIGGRTGHLSELVAPNGPTTYGRAPGSACWALVPVSAPQALTDVGHEFPYFDRSAQILAPRQVAGGWALRAVDGKGTTETVVLDTRSLLVRTLTAQQGGLQVTMHAQSLDSPVHLPVPAPRCA